MRTALQRIHYLDALAGAGKTYRLCHYAHDRVLRGGKFVIAQPSKLLIDNTIRDEFGRLADIDYQDDESFIAGLKALHGNRVERKEDAGLISPASFDPSMDEKTSRGLGKEGYGYRPVAVRLPRRRCRPQRVLSAGSWIEGRGSGWHRTRKHPRR